ncbi:hypothetical protein BDB01DRAFT_844278 [Pilobolus umbonatus]|nr:hypothetical protein BDB01DRAFT_844278 [Pilobolus umbonatus]
MEDTDAPIQSPSDKDTIDIPDFNLSFFENESTDLLNLTKTLGANITINIYGSDEDRSKAESVPAIVETTAKLTRASQILESSLSEVFSDNDEEFPFIQKESDREVQLTSELDKAHSKLLVLQSKYSKIKEASRQALDEFTNAKEEFSKEVILRQQQEHTITQLKHQLDILCKSKSMDRTEVAKITKTEIERIAKIRQELDKSCNDLKAYRNMLIQDIESLAQQKQSTFELEQQKALLIEISSLKLERDYIQDTTRDLQKTKEETLYEMVVLNTKNAELSEMNNALSRRVTEREREAVAVMAGTSFMFSPSASLSSELCSPVSNPRKSSEASIGNILDLNLSSPPKMFKLKKKNNMFAKLSGKSSKVDQSNSTVYGMTNASASAMNISNQSISHPHTKDRKYMNDSQQSAHTFQPTSFLRRTKCDACGDKIWGSTELRCAGCNYVSHTKCVSNVPQLCFGGNTNNSFELNPSDADLGRTSSGLFGSDLTLRAQAEERAIPWIIEACIEAVEIRGMDYEGIYRKTGGASQVRLIHRSFESGEPIDLTDDNVVNDICAVTSILKQYFRELPNPLLPFNLYTQFISTVSIHDIHEKSDRFFELLSQLPKVNYETLKFLIQHLNRVQQCHAENLMTTKNLAMVFGPSLMRDIESNRDLIDMSLKNAVIEYLIIHSSELFSL